MKISFAWVAVIMLVSLVFFNLGIVVETVKGRDTLTNQVQRQCESDDQWLTVVDGHKYLCFTAQQFTEVVKHYMELGAQSALQQQNGGDTPTRPKNNSI